MRHRFSLVRSRITGGSRVRQRPLPTGLRHLADKHMFACAATGGQTAHVHSGVYWPPPCSRDPPLTFHPKRIRTPGPCVSCTNSTTTNQPVGLLPSPLLLLRSLCSDPAPIRPSREMELRLRRRGALGLLTASACVFLFSLGIIPRSHAAGGGDASFTSWSPRELDTGGLSRAVFPKGFVFGTAASAYQVEGMASKDGRGPSIWDVFVKVPGNIAMNATADVTVDEYHRYKEDVDIMKQMNFDAYRFSISWSRIFPSGTGKVNWKGVAYYNRLIDYMLSQGITPYANLYHYDLPAALEDKYKGLLSRRVIKDFADYADFCFKTFGDRVKNWFTFNEPRVVAALGYDNGFFAPARCSRPFGNCTDGNSATEPYIVAHNLILCHAAAVQRYREKYQDKQKGRIGILLDFVWYEPLTNSKEDEEAAQRARDFHIGWFLHPIIYGEYPKNMQEIVAERLPKFTNQEVKLVKGSTDYVGINQYTSYYMEDPHRPKLNYTGYQMDWNAKFVYERNGVPIGPRANSYWLYIVPWGLYKAMTYVKVNYGNPVVILSENGMDDLGYVTLSSGLHDVTRLNYYKSYITELKKAIDEGANVIGYFAWSLLDNFEWKLGYTARFGIVYVDFKTLKRYPKMSAYWFQKMLH